MAFVALVAVVIVGFAIYLGPHGIAFVLHDDRKTAPFVMVNLLDFEDEAAELRYREGYAASALSMIRAVGGEVLWEGRLDGVLKGRSRDRWPIIALVAYPSRAVFIDLVTSSEYRALLDVPGAMPARSALLAGTPRSAFEPGGVVFAMRLVRGVDDDWRKRYDAEWQSEDLELLARHAGRVVFRAGMNPLVAEDEDAFDEAWLMAFDSTEGRGAWVNDRERRTVQSLEHRLLRRDVLLLLSTPVVEKHADGRELVEFAQVGERPGLDFRDRHERRIR